MFKRTATELLSSKKDDVQSVLLATLHGKNEEIVKILRTFPYFNGWSQESIKQCCILASIKRYLPSTVITDQTDNMNHGYTYFVIDGVCSVVQKITLRVRTGFGGRKLFAIRENHVENENSNHQDIIFVTIRYFSNGDCFGLGEDLTDKWIVSDKAVRCLVVPKDFLLQHNRNNIWSRQLRKITASFPSDALIYDSLLQQVKWFRYKKELVNHSTWRKKINNTTLDHVPYYWRICIDVPECLV